MQGIFFSLAEFHEECGALAHISSKRSTRVIHLAGDSTLRYHGCILYEGKYEVTLSSQSLKLGSSKTSNEPHVMI